MKALMEPEQENAGLIRMMMLTQIARPSWGPTAICVTATVILLAVLMLAVGARAEDGYDLWLRYSNLQNPALLVQYRTSVTEIVVMGDSLTSNATREELRRGLSGLLGRDVPATNAVTRDGAVLVSAPNASPEELSEVRGDGYHLFTKKAGGKQITVIGARTELGGLYGAFGLLRMIQTGRPIDKLHVVQNPKLQYRLLDHWDHLNNNRTGNYAGYSLWFSKWNALPDTLDPRFVDYARACASVGINGTVLNNLFTKNDWQLLRQDNLAKVSALAAVFRPYGIRVYLSPVFDAPISLGGLATADPLDPKVTQWWKAKSDEIYKAIPDFGGFLVKADSEGRPGPKDYGRTHAEGANVLAKALAPHGGILMWRAFVYDVRVDPDRAKRAYKEFVPLDGKFATNAFLQVKDGPLDFQPREPFHPLWGAMPKTQLMMEFEVKQEYLGHATHLVHLAELWQDVLRRDTFAKGTGSTIARAVDGSLDGHTLSGIAGVANIGTDRNWCGHPFAQANWYAFGRLAWDPYLNADAIAEEWTRMTWGNDPMVVSTILGMMKGSWQAAIDVRGPLGLNFTCGNHHDPGPAKRINDYWQAGTNGIGYNRTDHAEKGWVPPSGSSAGRRGKNSRAASSQGSRNSLGTDAVGQYREPLRSMFNDLHQCPEDYLLWFHLVPWDHKVRSGRTLWEELCFRYDRGYEYARSLEPAWRKLEGRVDAERFVLVSKKLDEQERHAREWRDTCVNFFAKTSGQAVPGLAANRAATP